MRICGVEAWIQVFFSEFANVFRILTPSYTPSQSQIVFKYVYNTSNSICLEEFARPCMKYGNIEEDMGNHGLVRLLGLYTRALMAMRSQV